MSNAERKVYVDQAIDDGYLDSPSDARYYDVCDDGSFHLKTNQFIWFKVSLL